MRADARIVAEADGRGGTRLAVLHGESPLLLRRTGAPGPGGVTVHLVGGAAGPLRGDQLRLTVTVGPGAALEVRSVAAQLALPGRAGLPASRLTVRAEVATGGTLRWLPEPLIAAAGCDHSTVTHVEVAAGGTLLWRDDLVCGRHAEPSGDVRTEITVRYAGATLHRHDLAVGPAADGWSGAAVLGSGRAIGTVVAAPRPTGGGPAGGGPTGGGPTGDRPTGDRLTNHPPASRPAGDWAARAEQGTRVGDLAVMPLAGPGMLATAVGADIRQVRAALDPLCAPGAAGRRPVPAPVPA